MQKQRQRVKGEVVMKQSGWAVGGGGGDRENGEHEPMGQPSPSQRTDNSTKNRPSCCTRVL